MPSFFWIVARALRSPGSCIIAVIVTLLVKSGKLKLKKGGAPGTSSGGRLRRGLVALARQDREQRAELDLGLVELRRGVGVAHDADPGVEPRLGAAQQRAAQRDAELAVVVGVRPADGAGVPAAVQALQGGDQRRRRARAARRPRPASGAAGRRARPRDSGWASCARIGVARCWMFATLISAGSSGAATQTACGRSARAIRRDTISCSSRSLSLRSSCSPRWSSTAGSAERRVEPASATVCARAPSRRISSSGEAATNAASPRPAQKT